VGLLRNPAPMQLPGRLLFGLGVYELVEGNGLGAFPAALGLPLLAVGSLLGGTVNVPTISPSTSRAARSSAKLVLNAETEGAKVGSIPKVANANVMGGSQNARRNTVNINGY